jgi:hypothetical protein
MMARQGDLLIVKVEAIPANARKRRDLILAEGEATGHMHALDTGELYEAGGTLYFRTPEGRASTLSHQEHHAITFAPGVYKVIRQREYLPEGWKHVSD